MRFSDEKVRLLVILTLVVLVPITGLVSYWLVDIWFSVFLIVALIITLFLIKPLLRPRPNRIRLRIVTLTLFFAVVALLLEKSVLFSLLNVGLVELGAAPIKTPSDLLKGLILIVSGGVMLGLNLFFDRRTIIDPTGINGGVNAPFKEPAYQELRDRFCDYMITQINRANADSNWSDHNYTTLEAEVEVAGNRVGKSRIEKNLIRGIRKSKNVRSFLLIGEPGSGKSVSLRFLTKQLYLEVKKQGDKAVVPLYVNLKEWDGPNEITDESITDFTKRYIAKQAGRDGKKFLDKYFDRMVRNGAIFFLFDSFDELPMVLDTDDRSSEIKAISNAFDIFFHDLHSCRGILSSRHFRQPVGFSGQKIIIRPFQEDQIKRAMKNWLLAENVDTGKLIKRIFTHKPHLVPALRNPFMSELIAIHAADFQLELPESYYELFNHYVNKRLDEDIDKLKELGLEKEEVIKTAIKVAHIIYTHRELGLETDVYILLDNINDEQLLDKLEILRYSRIARWGGSKRDRFSFVHRRFAEFFSVHALLMNPSLVRKDSIPLDSRWRDSLVVYCGVADIKDVKALANYTWGVVKEKKESLLNNQIQLIRPAVHCLRFLRDACLSRPDAIEDFREELSYFIIELIQKEELFVAKLACEILPITNAEKRSEGLEFAFKHSSNWLAETAIRSCRHLAGLDQKVVDSIDHYIRRIDTLTMVSDFRMLDFNLSLSESLKRVRSRLRLDMVWVLVVWVAFILSTMIVESYLSGAYSVLLFVLMIEYQIFTPSKKKQIIFP